MNALFSALSRYVRPPAAAAGSRLHRRAPAAARRRDGRALLRPRKPPIAEGLLEGES
jgi:hypothetical protein